MDIEVLKFDSILIAETGTSESSVTVAGHGAVAGDFFFNLDRSDRPVDRLAGDTARRRISSATTDTFEVSTVSGQTAGDVLMLYKFVSVEILDASAEIDVTTQQEESIAKFSVLASYDPPGTSVFVDGINDAGDPDGRTYSFTIATAALAEKTAQGDARGYIAAEGYGGNLYSFFGQWDTAFYDTINIYNVSLDSWSAGTPGIVEKATLQSAVIGDYIYEAGGDDLSNWALADASAYSIAGDSWSAIANVNPRATGDGVAMMDVFFVARGYDESQFGLEVDEYYVPANDTWYSFSSPFGDIYSGTKFHWHNDYKAYITGGINADSDYVTDNISLHFPSRAYYYKSSIPSEQAYLSACALEQYGLAGFGSDGGITQYDELYLWSEPRDTWTVMDTHPDASYAGGAGTA